MFAHTTSSTVVMSECPLHTACHPGTGTATCCAGGDGRGLQEGVYLSGGIWRHLSYIGEVLCEETFERGLIGIACLGYFAGWFVEDICGCCKEFFDCVVEKFVEITLPICISICLRLAPS